MLPTSYKTTAILTMYLFVRVRRGRQKISRGNHAHNEQGITCPVPTHPPPQRHPTMPAESTCLKSSGNPESVKYLYVSVFVEKWRIIGFTGITSVAKQFFDFIKLSPEQNFIDMFEAFIIIFERNALIVREI
jgi:hypothetical protein